LEQMMRPKLLLAVAVVLSVSMTSALAEDCPVKPIDMDAIIAALNAAPDCKTSMKLFEACQFGSTADIQLGDVVEKKCEAQFLTKLKPTQQHTYQDQLGRCDAKFAGKQGTMWRSAAAMCRASVSQRTAQGKLK
jgi:hypothetical protein